MRFLPSLGNEMYISAAADWWFNISRGLDCILLIFFLFLRRNMAKLLNHARSISLPSSSHPLFVSLEQQLERLRSSEGASTSSQLSASQKLDSLRILYESLDDVLQLPFSQQGLSHVRNGNWEEEVLDGSLRLLDVCGTLGDIYSQMKENIQNLESSLRRKKCGELASEIDVYLVSRKKLNKMIQECNKELKRTEKSCKLPESTKELELVNLIKEIQEISITIFESTLAFISRSESQPKSWFLVTRLMNANKLPCHGDSDVSGIEKIKAELLLLKNKKPNHDKNLHIQNLLKQLEAVGSSIQEAAGVLETIFRLLLKTRVSFLNNLSN